MEKNQSYVEGRKNSNEGERGDPNKVSPAAVERYLNGVSFPVKKDDLIAKAKENKAPSDVMNVLNRLDDEKEFRGIADISKEIGGVE